jgi:hypothetical protein
MEGSHRRRRRETGHDRVRPSQEAPEEHLVKRDRGWGWLRRFAIVVGAMLVAAGLLLVAHVNSSSIRVLGNQKFALPSTTSGCSGGVALAGGAFRVPIKVSSVGSEVEASVNVCVDGQGPFPFVIDTGASSSAIDLSLAQRLHLPMLGSPQRYAGLGCTGTTQFEELTAWSMAGLPLAGQPITAQTIPGWGGEGEPVGLLGADVLSRFGALRFDFAAQTMTLPGFEAPAPNGPSLVTGPLASPIPSNLISVPPSSISGLSVTEGPNYAVATALVHFRGADQDEVFELDTGASRSVVRTSLTRKLGLASTSFLGEIQTSCSKITVPLVQSGPWSLNNVQLAPLMLRSTDLGQLRPTGINGLLGLDELSRFEYAIIDFKGATLALGPPRH